MLMMALAAAAVLAIASPPAARIEGERVGDLSIYRGIPYVRPPVGPLRWRAPQPLPRATAPIKALKFGNICPQPDPKGDKGVGNEAQDEDCLTLNIWAPAGKVARRPVMVWLHGGGYTSGSGSAPLYDGSALARRGVVVVTLNYRLGRLGFFAHPQMPPTESANFGLLDQQAALRWVQRNIAAFGGDPRRVTLFGNSAGGESVLFHMMARGSRGLFGRAIVQSGLGGRHLRTASETILPRQASTALEQLRTLPASDILKWESPSLYRGFGPSIDGVLIRESIEANFAAGRQARIPLVIGSNSFEFPPAFAGGTGALLALVGHGAVQRAAGIAAYGSQAAYEQRIASDLLFKAPALRLARLHARAGLPAWSYEFDVVAAAAAARLEGAPHASERAYVFGTLGSLDWPTGAADRTMANDLGARWAAFARGTAPGAGWAPATPLDARSRVFTHRVPAPDPRFAPALARYHGL